MDGNVVRRQATITQENHQRAKCLSHTYQKRLRQEQLDEIVSVANRKAEKNKQEVLRILAKNNDAENKIVAGTGKTTEQIGELTLAELKRPTGPELKAFIYARKFSIYPRPAGSFKWPSNKGKPGDVTATQPIDCLLLRAYEMRNQPVILVAQDAEADSPAEPTEDTPTPPPAIAATIATVNSSVVFEYGKASDILASEDFLAVVDMCFNSTGNNATMRTVSESMLELSNKLQSRLFSRLTVHKEKKVPAAKQNHWCLLWFTKNLPIVSAVMVALNHVKSDLSCLDPASCLLSSNNNFLLATNSEANLEGSYLYFDTNKSVWVRSGKVTGRSLVARHQEHHRAAKGECESRFYSAYPSRENSRLTSDLERRGWFENLAHCVAVGWDRSVVGVSESLTTDRDTEGGLFRFTREYKNKIDRVRFHGPEGVQGKQFHMVAYLCELSYDLALAAENNMSMSPGFETPMGVFGGTNH